jgi:M6 family metalloprotease-like protein
VFLIDWSDFNPVTDPSNLGNPNSVFSGYIKKTPEEISYWLNNDPAGPAAYYHKVSGGQFSITFNVYPWMVSDQATYLKNRREYYYLDPNTGNEVILTGEVGLDVLRSAIADWNVDFTLYDADHNKYLDGFVIVYEGRSGLPCSTNLWSIGKASGYLLPEPHVAMKGILSTLVPEEDPNYTKFQGQKLLYHLYNNIPEQTPGGEMALQVWPHELGHLLLGYSDYYTYYDLGAYALSSGMYVTSAMEKYFFAHWLEPLTVSLSGTYTLTNHLLKPNEVYATDKHYLLQVPINNDPHRFLTIENLYYDSSEASQYNYLERGLVVFEVDKYIAHSIIDNSDYNSELRRLIPERVRASKSMQSIGALTLGDRLVYTAYPTAIVIEPLSVPSQDMVLNVSLVDANSDIQPPTVEISTPKEAEQVTNMVTIVADPHDDFAVKYVEFYYNNTYVIGRVDEVPYSRQGYAIKLPLYSVQWDTKNLVKEAYYTLTAKAVDWAGNETLSAPVRVYLPDPALNHDPVLNLIGNKMINEMDVLTFTISATDIDPGDVLTYSAPILPPGASFNISTATFSWQPQYDMAGTYTARFEVSDVKATDFEEIAITVNNVNRAPILYPIGNKTTNSGQVLTFEVDAVDLDAEAVTYSATGLPSGSVLDSATGLFSWTPTSQQGGAHQVTFIASDGSLTDSELVTITVNVPNVLPVFDNFSLQYTVTVGSNLNFKVSASDANGDTLTLKAASALPKGSTFTPGTTQLMPDGTSRITGIFSWTPNKAQVGTYTLTFSVTDSSGGEVMSAPVVIQVVNSSGGGTGGGKKR